MSQVKNIEDHRNGQSQQKPVDAMERRTAGRLAGVAVALQSIRDDDRKVDKNGPILMSAKQCSKS